MHHACCPTQSLAFQDWHWAGQAEIQLQKLLVKRRHRMVTGAILQGQHGQPHRIARGSILFFGALVGPGHRPPQYFARPTHICLEKENSSQPVNLTFISLGLSVLLVSLFGWDGAPSGGARGAELSNELQALVIRFLFASKSTWSLSFPGLAVALLFKAMQATSMKLRTSSTLS